MSRRKRSPRRDYGDSRRLRRMQTARDAGRADRPPRRPPRAREVASDTDPPPEDTP